MTLKKVRFHSCVNTKQASNCIKSTHTGNDKLVEKQSESNELESPPVIDTSHTAPLCKEAECRLTTMEWNYKLSLSGGAVSPPCVCSHLMPSIRKWNKKYVMGLQCWAPTTQQRAGGGLILLFSENDEFPQRAPRGRIPHHTDPTRCLIILTLRCWEVFFPINRVNSLTDTFSLYTDLSDASP